MKDPSIPDWLKTLDLEQYAPLLLKNEVDFRTLQVLTDEDLAELGLPFGPRKLILKSLQDMKRRGAERRQLTVLFCDLVGFTELTGRLDPEVIQTIIDTYEDTCANCITHYDGYVFQRLGDGVVAFFGFPLAHEGEAERAIRAGLEIIETLAQLRVPGAGHLRVRIGIATGVVVVTSGEKGAVGETMSLAARLQAIAEPESVVVSARVRRLAAGVFDYRDLGEQHLKGIAQPLHAYCVLGLSTVASRFEAATEDITPLIGRDEEVAALLERWKLAHAGRGQVVLLSGEAGIGKSRIVSTIRERLEIEGTERVRFQCSPYYVNSAFYPFIDTLERTLEFERDQSAQSKLDKLEAFMSGRHGRPLDDVRLVATILSIPCEERYGHSALHPQRAKEETIRAFIDLLDAVAAQPTLVLFEDLHWADPTSLEVMDQLIERVQAMPVLVVLTCRPEFQSRWSGQSHVKEIDLGKLNRDETLAMVSRLTSGKALPAELLAEIIRRTDGIPLFVEELTKTILESGDLKEEDGRYAYARGDATTVTIPATLRDSLMARLDRLATVKEIAQIGSAIGREFSYELISAVAPMTTTALADALGRLTESGLAYHRGTIPQAVYTFKHALVQDAAYDSLLKSRRQQLHGEIAHALDEKWPDTRETEPELLAHHYTAAHLEDEAVPLWRRAGEISVKRFALQEAVAHLRKGLGLVQALPAGTARDLKELELRTLLGPAIVALHGWAIPEVGHVLRPAWTLAESHNQRQRFIPILHGLWVHYLCLARLQESLRWAEKLMAASTAKGDDLEIVGHRAACGSYYWMGDLASSKKHGDIILEEYDAERHRHIVTLTNTDPLTGGGLYRGQVLWMLGYPDRAVKENDEKDDHARRINHPFDLAFALTLGAQLFVYRSEPEQLLRRTEEAERIGRERQVPLMSEVMAEISKGAAWLHQGRIAESIPQLREAVGRLRKTGHCIWIWYLRGLLAEALVRSGDLEGGMAIIDESLAQLEHSEEHIHFAEVLRLKGWILLQQGKLDEAEPYLQRAIAVAREQQAKSWELRAATTLARLMADRGEHACARDLLRPIYDWFTEGFETKDLKEAKALIDELEFLTQGDSMSKTAWDEVRELETRFVHNANAKDPAGLVQEYYAHDAVLMPPGSPENIHGTEAILPFWKQLLIEEKAVDISITTQSVQGSGDLAYEIGQFGYTAPDPKQGGKAVRTTGKFVVVYKRQSDGKLKAAVDIFNVNDPA